MTAQGKAPLKVFLCHASGDKPVVRELYKRLIAEGVDAWLDQEKLLPGQDWRVEIPRAVREADVVVICLSNKSITKEGYVQKEIRFALDSAEEKPEGTIFLIPARLEDCTVPERLDRWQWVDLFDENGFLKLLRSLKVRADKVGAVIEPSASDDTDSDLEHRLDQLYTEGLAAFWVEDWDRACQRFQAILRERPNHKNASEKLAQAERQRDFARLYEQATEAYQSENWVLAGKALEDLLEKAGDYKDAISLLKKAKKQRQLKELYVEAKRLHAAQKWKAVLKVFEQIAAVDPSYPDPESLLPSAQKEVTELKRLNELNDLYRQAVLKMEEGQWYEARGLLEQVHKAQTGFLDTERLLRKVEDEIVRIEELSRRNIHVNTLYEQAQDLIHSKNWRKALEQIEEIRKLDDQFLDPAGIAEKAKTELEREEQQVQRQRELNILYAEAVSLLDAKKYQEALEKWNAIQAIDPKYKDSSRVRIIAKRRLDELSATETAGWSWRTPITKWISVEANIPADRIILTEKLLLLAFAVIVIVILVYLVIADLTYIREADAIARFLSLFALGGLYGIVVAFVLSKVISNWHRKQWLTVVIGWALAQSVPWVIRQYVAVNFITIYALFAGLSTTIAIKWASPATRPINLIMIFASWIFAWKIGAPLGIYLQAAFNNQYIASIADPLAVLLGLLLTLGIQIEGSWEILKTALFGALGFAAGNYIVDVIFPVLLPSTNIGVFIAFTLWGSVGGAILGVPSRNARRILFSAAICGIGLFAGSFVAFVILPAVVGQSYLNSIPERYAALRQICSGVGLGLAFGSFIRRASAIGILIVLGAGIYMFTATLFSIEFYEISSIPDAVRGALIGLVLGYAYGYMRQAKSVVEVQG